MLECQRHRFSLPDDVHYLNGAYMSPLLMRVEEAGIEGIRSKRFPVDIVPRDFFAGADTARTLFAGLINARDPRRVAILPAVSYGIAAAARNTPVAAGQNIVLAEGQFPSNALIWRRLARERGAEVRTVPGPHLIRGRSREWTARIQDAIDGDTAAVALAPVHWTDGTRFDLSAIGARTADVGAAFVIDGTQAVGAMPVDIAETRADALVCAAYKWLLGPYSMAFGWFGPRYDRGTPLEEAWLARVESDDFRNLVAYREEYRPAAARYDVGGRSNFVLMPMAIAALEQLLDWGVPSIEAYCHSITAELFGSLEALGYEADEEAGRAAHLFGLYAPEGLDNAALKAELDRRRIYVSLRGSAVRVSPNVYN
ncbi:MAG: aminotransferase class V-fold PLP-dependent enzyme, partial [Longimicrobiales bacterium]|nr:aminotransferase class V-fold PLP-dependent enzyme [Longimicrobiales bacterium]